MSAKKSKKIEKVIPVEKKAIPVKETSKVESKEELPVVKKKAIDYSSCLVSFCCYFYSTQSRQA